MSRYQQMQQAEAEQAAAGWHSMTLLIARVQAGQQPLATPPTIACRPQEVQYGTLPVNMSIFCGADVEYSSSMFSAGGLFLTAASLAASAAVNANNRRKAQAAAAPQWRLMGRFPAIVTSERLLVMAGQWSSYYHDHLLMIEPNPLGYSVALHYERTEPIMLHGPWVPWATVAICASRWGTPWPPGFVPPPQLQAVVRPPAQVMPSQRPPDQAAE
ncbi:hypothetical protein AB0B57_03415 [Micromonospora sp. NPDC049101]|uniref:hypothetical protein n=1 Tax=Micromonospora sp. NPDC049101 TaxID=3155032 RepID=UPI003401015F